MGQHVVVVNEAGEALGILDTKAAHDGLGVRHRAFTVFIHNPNHEVLLCRRSHLKRLWPGHWENSCSSHPSPDESCLEAGARRLREELGFTAELRFLGAFEYHAVDGNAGAEHEFCPVLAGEYSGEVCPDPSEVAECRWYQLKQLLASDSRDQWAPWPEPGLGLLASHLSGQAGAPE